MNPYAPPATTVPSAAVSPPAPQIIRTPGRERIRNTLLRFAPKSALLIFILCGALLLAHYFGYASGIPPIAVSIGIFVGASINGIVQGLKNDDQILVQRAANLLLTPPLVVGRVGYLNAAGQCVKGLLCLSATEARFRPKRYQPGIVTLKLEDIAEVIPDVRSKRLTLLCKGGRKEIFHTACSTAWMQKFDEAIKSEP